MFHLDLQTAGLNASTVTRGNTVKSHVVTLLKIFVHLMKLHLALLWETVKEMVRTRRRHAAAAAVAS